MGEQQEEKSKIRHWRPNVRVADNGRIFAYNFLKTRSKEGQVKYEIDKEGQDLKILRSYKRL